MPNIASALKAEISRVARKEVRGSVEPLKKAVTEQRRVIAALRKKIDDMERDMRRTVRGAQARVLAAPSDRAEEPKRRFSPTRLAKHRAKLGLSASDYGRLVGVSGQTIYKWEQGSARPRAAQLQALAGVRGIGKRQATARLTQQAA